MSTTWSFDTLQIHAGQTPDSQTGARALPIYQTTSFVFKDTDQAAARFGLTELGPIYTRLNNPTTEVVENRLAALEGGVGALLVSSGQAAESLAILTLGGAGSHIVASPSLYGGTYNLLHHTLPKLGIETTFVANPDDPEQWRAAARPTTIAFFGESISNPKQDVLDIEAIATVAHEVGVPLIIDNTIAPPPLLPRPGWGAAIVTLAATKYGGGHGPAPGGGTFDAGRFDYGAHPDRFPQFNEPDESYHGLVYSRDLGAEGVFGVNLSFILKARLQGLRDLGQAISPFNAFLLAQGIETLSLRVQRHSDNALAVARWLEQQPGVLSVAYSGLETSAWHARARKYAPRGGGGVLAFTLAGGLTAGKAFVDALELHSLVANIGDVRSLVTPRGPTTHSQPTPKDHPTPGVNPGPVRLSVGLEDIRDIIADLEKGFAAVRALTADASAA